MASPTSPRPRLSRTCIGCVSWCCTFAGVTFEEYRGQAAYVKADGTLDTRRFIEPGEAHAFPLGTVDTFGTYFAPADFNETVNTLGQPLYAKQAPRQFDRGTDLHTQSNPLPMCHRPGVPPGQALAAGG